MDGERTHRLGRYRLIQRIGVGGMGEVWEAELQGPTGFRKAVAIKVLPQGPEDERARAALVREARLGALVAHPNVVGILDLGRESGTWYVALELVRGPSVGELIARQPLSVGAALDVAIGVAAGLSQVHRLVVDGRPAGLVHRDVKPENILVDPAGLVKLTDLGIASMVGAGDTAAGTPGYMAPEQLGGAAEPRSDLFSLGVTLFRMVIGVEPFGFGSEAMSRIGDIEEMLHADGIAERCDAVMPGLGTVVFTCLRADPVDRWEDASSLMDALRRLRVRTETPGLLDSLHERHHPTSLVSALAPSSPLPRPLGATVEQLPTEILPRSQGKLIGREADSRRLVDAVLEGTSPICVSGPPGVGKSRLAIDVARMAGDALQGGVVYVGLAETPVDALTTQVARALDPEGSAADPPARVRAALAARGACVVVLDDVDHLAAVLPQLVAGWSRAAPRARWVVTSRRALLPEAAMTLPVPPLSHVEGLRLFRDRRGADAPGEGDSVGQLVTALDGIPLAIELAAARARSLGVAPILARLQDRLQVLSQRHGLPRHRSLGAALDTSWALLSPVEQVVLTQLSVLVGGFTLQAAEAVVDVSAGPGESEWTIDHVVSLVEHGLIVPEADRFRLLGTVRAYAGARLARLGGVDDAQERHGAWFAQFGELQAMESLMTHGGPERFRALAADLPNLIAASERAIRRVDLDVALSAGVAALHMLRRVGPHDRACRLGEALARVPGVRERPLWGRVGRLWALAMASAGHQEDALGVLRPPGVDPGDDGARGGILGILMEGRAEEAVPLLEHAVLAFREQGNRVREGVFLGNLAVVLRTLGRVDEAEVAFDAALRRNRAVGNRTAEANVLASLGVLAYVARDLPRADARLAEAAAIAEEMGLSDLRASISHNQGLNAERGGHFDVARAHFESSRDAFGRTGRTNSLALAYAGLGRMAQARLELDVARRNYDLAQVHAERGAPVIAASFALRAGVMAFYCGDMAHGIEQMRGAAERLSAHKDREAEAEAWEKLGGVLTELGRFGPALEALARCRDAAEGTAYPELFRVRMTWARALRGDAEGPDELEEILGALEPGSLIHDVALAMLAEVLLLFGDWHGAEAACDQLGPEALSDPLSSSDRIGLGILRADIALDLGKTDEAQRRIEATMTGVGPENSIDRFIAGKAVLARIRRAQGDLRGARRALKAAEAAAAPLPLEPGSLTMHRLKRAQQAVDG